jgi:hypothetical protein
MKRTRTEGQLPCGCFYYEGCLETCSEAHEARYLIEQTERTAKNLCSKEEPCNRATAIERK